MSGDVPEGHLQIPRFQPGLIVVIVSAQVIAGSQGLVTRSRAKAERAGATAQPDCRFGGTGRLLSKAEGQ